MNIEVKQVSKNFRGKPVLQGISFHLKEGKVLAIGGSVGSGKTTLMRLIMHLLQPDEGEILYNEKPFHKAIRQKIGYLPQARGVYPNYTVIQILTYFAQLKNLTARQAQVEAVRVLDHYDMIDYLDTPFRALPLLEKEKLLLLTCIVHHPDLLVLDEPFKNFQPLTQDLIKKLILHYKQEKRTVILATEQLDTLEPVCDEIVFLHQGKSVLAGKLADIRKKHRAHIIEVEAEDNLTVLKDLPGVQKFQLSNQVARLFIDPGKSPQGVVGDIVKQVRVTRVEVNRMELSDIYQEVVQQRKAHA